MKLLPIALVGSLLGAGVVSGQQPVRDPGSQPQTGTSAIFGTVTVDGGGQPVRRATVTVTGGGLRMARQVMTDSSGRFVVAELPTGSFNVEVAKPTFITTTYGAKQPNQRGTPVAVKAGERAVIDMKIPRGAVLAGTITDQYGRPKPQVRVQAFGYRMMGGQRRMQSFGTSLSTDDRGAYRIYGLPAGDYVLMAMNQSGGGQDIKTVTPEELRWAMGDGRTGSSPAPATPPPAAGSTYGYVPLYFPGVFDLGAATTLTLNAGEERLGMDLQLQTAMTAKIEGVLFDPDGRAPQQPQVSLVSEERMRMGVQSPPIGMPSDNANIDQGSGRFTFNGVPPGHYTLFARSIVRPAVMPGPAPLPPPPPVAPAVPAAPVRAGGPGPLAVQAQQPTTLWAMAQVDVSGRDLSGLTITLQPALAISGRIAFESSSQPAPTDISRVRINMTPIDSLFSVPGIPSVTPSADGTFSLRGAIPGRYRISTSGPGGGWILKSAVANGRDTLDTGLEVTGGDVTGVQLTFSDQVADLSGTLVDAAGAPTRDYWVLVFSTDRSFWTPQSRRSRVTRPDQAGRFRFSQWPPGEYYLVAVTDGDQMDLTDRAAMEQIAAVAYKVTLAEGEKKVENLKVAR